MCNAGLRMCNGCVMHYTRQQCVTHCVTQVVQVFAVFTHRYNNVCCPLQRGSRCVHQQAAMTNGVEDMTLWPIPRERSGRVVHGARWWCCAAGGAPVVLRWCAGRTSAMVRRQVQLILTVRVLRRKAGYVLLGSAAGNKSGLSAPTVETDSMNGCVMIECNDGM